MTVAADHAVATERVAVCPICGHRRSSLVCRSGDRQHGCSDQCFTYSRCLRCRAVYQSHRPHEAGIGTFYPAAYGPYQASPVLVRSDAPSKLRGPHRWFPSRIGRKWLARINAAVNRRFPDPLPEILNEVYTPRDPRATLLDFGCGSSAFLDVAKRSGWTTIGVDFLPEIVDCVRGAGHAAYLAGDDTWRRIPPASIDVIRMNHVIEHLYHPLEVMAQLRRCLKPGGRLHLATPNNESWTFRFLGQCWFPLEAPRHIVIYSPRVARRLLRTAGFTRVACHQEVLTKDAARSVGYWLHDRGQVSKAEALAMPQINDLAQMLFVSARFAALSGGADRFHAIASV